MANFKVIGKWKDDLIWCPSQCELVVKYKNKRYILYLRWRWADPWQGYICTEKEFITGDLFAEKGLFFKADELDKAKKALLQLAKQWLAEHSKE